MISKLLVKLLVAGAFAVAAASVAPAYAGGVDKDGGFYATPIQKGAPRDLPGEQLVPGANLAVDVIDGVTRPLIVDPIQTAGAFLGGPAAPPPAAAAPAGGHHHGKHHHHHAAHHHNKKHK